MARHRRNAVTSSLASTNFSDYFVLRCITSHRNASLPAICCRRRCTLLSSFAKGWPDGFSVEKFCVRQILILLSGRFPHGLSVASRSCRQIKSRAARNREVERVIVRYLLRLRSRRRLDGDSTHLAFRRTSQRQFHIRYACCCRDTHRGKVSLLRKKGKSLIYPTVAFSVFRVTGCNCCLKFHAVAKRRPKQLRNNACCVLRIDCRAGFYGNDTAGVYERTLSLDSTKSAPKRISRRRINRSEHDSSRSERSFGSLFVTIVPSLVDLVIGTLSFLDRCNYSKPHGW